MAEVKAAIDSGNQERIKAALAKALPQNTQLDEQTLASLLDGISANLANSKSGAESQPKLNGTHHAHTNGVDAKATEARENGDSHRAEESSVPAFVSSVERALTALKEGQFIVVADGEDRENEGDLIIAAEKATPERLAFMVNETSGLICCGITAKRTEELKLPQMVERNTESHGTAFTVSVDYKVGTTTGISAGDRAATIRALADPKANPSDFARPGHMFPLRARDGGVLVRPGHTEASVDLARLAGLYPAAAMCEIVNKDGTMMRPAACRKFATQHGLVYTSIADLIAYRKLKEKL